MKKKKVFFKGREVVCYGIKYNSLQAFAKSFNKDYTLTSKRFYAGWSPEEIASTPDFMGMIKKNPVFSNERKFISGKKYLQDGHPGTIKPNVNSFIFRDIVYVNFQDFASLFEIKHATVLQRLGRGYSLEDATIPPFIGAKREDKNNYLELYKYALELIRKKTICSQEVIQKVRKQSKVLFMLHSCSWGEIASFVLTIARREVERKKEDINYSNVNEKGKS